MSFVLFVFVVVVVVAVENKHETNTYVLKRTYLITESVTSHNDGLLPARHKQRDVLADDGLSEYRAAEDVSDRAVGTQPHLLQVEFGDARLVWRDGGALDAHVVLLDGLGRFNCHFVIGGVSVWQTQVVVFDVNVQIRQDQLHNRFTPVSRIHSLHLKVK